MRAISRRTPHVPRYRVDHWSGTGRDLTAGWGRHRRHARSEANCPCFHSDYGNYSKLRSADDLRVHRDRETSTVVLEYEVHGSSAVTGRAYDNPFVSVAASEAAGNAGF
ncbi:hypothetical protein ACFY4I_10385 [Streptomyces scabiei]|uniref:hypothetical protein n=1 Tax=Streptomyces scabiei TaxID=1930 RepID=UPI0036C63300